MNADNMEFTGNGITIRKIKESDKEICTNIWTENSVIKNVFNINEYKDKFNQAMWDEYTRPTTVAFLILNDSKEVCGICNLDNIDTATPCIGIDILEQHRNKGCGYKAIKLMLENTKNICNIEYFIWKCNTENIASQKLAEKLNGKLLERKFSFPQSIIDTGIEYGIYKTEDDVPQIFEYRIDADSL